MARERGRGREKKLDTIGKNTFIHLIFMSPAMVPMVNKSLKSFSSLSTLAWNISSF